MTSKVTVSPPSRVRAASTAAGETSTPVTDRAAGTRRTVP